MPLNWLVHGGTKVGEEAGLGSLGGGGHGTSLNVCGMCRTMRKAILTRVRRIVNVR